MTQAKEIVIIEDSDVGEQYREMLSQRDPTWNVRWVKSLSELQKLDGIERMHVLVFDQRLDANELGSDAFKWVHDQNPWVQGIMLSGVALAADLDAAQDVAGRSRVRHLTKDRVLELPRLVTDALTAYYASMGTSNTPICIIQKARHRLFAKTPEMSLISEYIVKDKVIFDDGWKEGPSIRAGVNVEETEYHQESDNKVIVTDIGSTTEVKIGTEMRKVTAALSSYFETNTSEQRSTRVENAFSTKRTYKLPDIPPSHDQEHPVEVKYQYAQVYQQIRACVKVKCPMCETASFHDFYVYCPTGHIAERQIAYYSNGVTNITDLTDP